MTTIVKVTGREILDSRGNPTVEADVYLADGSMGRAAVPSGASTGEHEAVELRDGDKSRYLGKGTLKADQPHQRRNRRGAARQGCRPTGGARPHHDRRWTAPTTRDAWAPMPFWPSRWPRRAPPRRRNAPPLFRYLGGVAASTLPVPMMNIINGGAHADNSVDVQEFMIAPFGATKFSEALRMGVEVFHTLKKVLHKKGYSTAVGDEGGFAPNLKSNEEAIESVLEAITQAGYQPGAEIGVCLDPAASEFFQDGKYVFKKSDKSARSPEQMVEYWSNWVRQYPAILSIEDGMSEEDWPGWKLLTETLGKQIQLVGDDIFVTNPEIFQRGIDQGIANSILIKLNQIGTLTETLEAMQMAARRGLHGGGFAPLGRNRRPVHRRPGGGHRRRPDQDRFGQPHRPHLQVQPVAAHRREAGRGRAVPGQKGLPALRRSHDQTGTGAPRRKHVEQGKPLHRLDRRGPLRKGPAGSPRSRRRAEVRRLRRSTWPTLRC